MTDLNGLGVGGGVYSQSKVFEREREEVSYRFLGWGFKIFSSGAFVSCVDFKGMAMRSNLGGFT